MSKKIIFSFESELELAKNLTTKINANIGKVELKHFPDGESYVRLHENVKDQEVIIISSLNQPDQKIMHLILLAQTAKELGASKVGLIAPYLAYMRQDIRFNQGEAVAARIFAGLISNYFDFLITIDPHLHRYNSLDEIYSIKNTVLHAPLVIADWINHNLKNHEKKLIIGPDIESQQWVEQVAKTVGASFIVLEKTRHSATEVEISIPDLSSYQDHTMILVDDIISTAGTMLKAIDNIKKLSSAEIYVIAVHALFANDAYQKLLDKKIAGIFSCNTVRHVSNMIDVSDMIARAVKNEKN